MLALREAEMKTYVVGGYKEGMFRVIQEFSLKEEAEKFKRCFMWYGSGYSAMQTRVRL